MAGTKKRKEPAQSSTLHDFFASGSIKKPRGGSLVPIPRLSAKRVATQDIALEDIIVISDDEQAQQDQSQSRIASSPSEYVSVKLKPEDFSYGTPAIHAQDQATTLQPSNGWPDFDPSGDAHDTFNVPPFCNQPRDHELPRYGDWEMGDDEGGFPQEEEEEGVFPQEEEEDGVEIEMQDSTIQLCGGQYPSVDIACPVCGDDLRGLVPTEVDRHVNSCLDALSGSPPHLKVELKKHKPLSAVQAPSFLPSTSTSAKTTSAFSILMSSHKENDAWKEASEAEKKKGNTRGRRPAPFYKVMQGMPIAVDAFSYGKIPGVTAYFLTHAHSDHYTNLSSSWKHGDIYCSQTTANLIIHMLNVDPKWVHPLPMDEPTVIPNAGDVKVTLIQANHCPGSVLFLFEGMQTVNAGDSTFLSPFVGSQRIFRYLHCGDFRACPQHVLHSEIKGKKIDTVYLDTTYLDPKYCFPPQPLVISACAELARRIVNGSEASSNSTGEKPHKNQGLMTGWITVPDKGKEKEQAVVNDERVLVVVGTYTIGKERIVKAIARALSTKVYCDARKAAVLGCLSDPELQAMLTTDPFAAGVHIVPLHVISPDTFQDYLAKWKGHWSRAVGFRPTGWSYTPPSGINTLPSIPHVIARDQARTFTHEHLRQMRNSTPKLMLYGVPYSEHSSFFELTCFALSLDWGKMIATVNVGSQKSRLKMTKWFEKWQAERNKRGKIGGEEIVKYRQSDYW